MKNRHASMILILCVLIAALSAGCVQKEADEPEELGELLLSQIDQGKEDFPDAYFDTGDKDFREILELKTIHYGSFTEAGKREILAVVKVLNVPHAGGLDRTIAAVYDADTKKLETLKTFASDNTELYCLPLTLSEQEKLLFIGNTTYQGVASYAAELYSLAGGEWTEESLSNEPLPVETTDHIRAYAYTDQKLHLLNLDYKDYQPVFSYLNTWFWDGETGMFVKKLP